MDMAARFAGRASGPVQQPTGAECHGGPQGGSALCHLPPPPPPLSGLHPAGICLQFLNTGPTFGCPLGRFEETLRRKRGANVWCQDV